MLLAHVRAQCPPVSAAPPNVENENLSQGFAESAAPTAPLSPARRNCHAPEAAGGAGMHAVEADSERVTVSANTPDQPPPKGVVAAKNNHTCSTVPLAPFSVFTQAVRATRAPPTRGLGGANTESPPLGPSLRTSRTCPRS